MPSSFHHDQTSATVLLTNAGDAVLTVVGEVDRSSAHLFVDALAHAAGAGTGAVRVNLSRVTFMDSAGVDAILRTLAALRADGRSVRVTKASMPVRRVLDIVGLAELVAAG